MTIQFTAGAPEDTYTKLNDWLPEIENCCLTNGATEGDEVNLSDAYEVKFLSISEIASGKLLDAIQGSHWRHLIMTGDGDQLNIHGEIELDDSQKPIALHTGRGKDGLDSAFKIAEQRKNEYNVSVLRCRPLCFIGLWLHNEQEDLIMPYPPNATTLKDYEELSVESVLEVLQPMARDLLKSVSDNLKNLNQFANIASANAGDISGDNVVRSMKGPLGS